MALRKTVDPVTVADTTVEDALSTLDHAVQVLGEAADTYAADKEKSLAAIARYRERIELVEEARVRAERVRTNLAALIA
jgi:hypothetical protein